MKNKSCLSFIPWLLFSLSLIACKPQLAETSIPIQADLPTSTQENTLIICLAQEPESLYPLSQEPAAQPILQAIYDGAIDQLNYTYHPVILTQIPTLSEGSATIQPIIISENESIVDARGNMARLTPGTQYRPAGCQSSDCTEIYQGGPIEMDQMRVVFTLRPDIVWSDGTPLTAKDSEFGYTFSKMLENPSDKTLIERTYSYEAIGTHATAWVGMPGFLDDSYMTHFFMPLPEHTWGNASPAEILLREDIHRAPLGWGAYQIDAWHPGFSITLSKNPHYFRAAEGYPYFDRLLFRFIGQDSEVALSMLQTNECDILDPSINLNEQSEALNSLRAAGEIQLTSMPDTSWEHLSFGIQHSSYDDGYQIGIDQPSFLNDVRTRQAIAYCIDRQAIANIDSLTQSPVLNTYLPSSHPLYNTNTLTYPHDTERGIELLEEAGWALAENGGRIAQDVSGVPDDTRLLLTYWTSDSPRHKQTAAIIQAALAKCGIEIVIEYPTIAELFADGPDGPLFGRQYDLAQFSWFRWGEPICQLFTSDTIPGPPAALLNEVPWLLNALGETTSPEQIAFPLGWHGWNLSGYANPTYDTTCNAAHNSVPGQGEYLENHLAAQARFASALPTLPLYENRIVMAARADLCGFTLSPSITNWLWNIEALGYDRMCK